MKFVKIALMVSTMLVAGCAEIVDEGNRGIRKNLGQVDKVALTPGMWWYNPFTTSIEEMNVQSTPFTAKITTYTKDIQQADISYQLNFHLDPAGAAKFYSQVGVGGESKILPPMTTSVVKRVFGRWTAVSAIASRGDIQSNIQTILGNELLKKGLILDNFEIADISYTKAFEDAVEAKEVATQRAIEEVNKTRQVEEQGRQVVITAEAQAKAMKVQADALASNPKLIEYEAVKKWRGEVPQYVGGGSPIPFINLNK